MCSLQSYTFIDGAPSSKDSRDKVSTSCKGESADRVWSLSTKDLSTLVKRKVDGTFTFFQQGAQLKAWSGCESISGDDTIRNESLEAKRF
jgi:hypothetical protein